MKGLKEVVPLESTLAVLACRPVHTFCLREIGSSRNTGSHYSQGEEQGDDEEEEEEEDESEDSETESGSSESESSSEEEDEEEPDETIEERIQVESNLASIPETPSELGKAFLGRGVCRHLKELLGSWAVCSFSACFLFVVILRAFLSITWPTPQDEQPVIPADHVFEELQRALESVYGLAFPTSVSS